MRNEQAMAVVGTVVMAAVMAPGAPTAATPAHEQHCATRQLMLEQLRAGARSQVRCFPTFREAMASLDVRVPTDATLAEQQAVAMQSSSILAVHHDGANGSGDSFSVGGTSCDGGGISLAAGDPWNDRISSTRHRLCTKVKHWVDAGYTGSSQLTEGSDGTLMNLNGTLSNAVTSIRYW
jgi:hypothetical protein